MKKGYSRREILGVGIGAAALGAYGIANAATQKGALDSPVEQKNSLHENHKKCGDDLERILLLRSAPVAVKMLRTEADIPEGAVRPKRDMGTHLAQCQAIAMSRRDKKTIAMLKEDHWCPTAVIAYGLAEKPESMEKFTHPYDCFELGKYIGMVSAPLQEAAFTPDAVIIYVKPSQLRALLLSLKIEDVPEVEHHFFPPSCGWSVVNPILDGKYRVVLPDPGEYQRALTDEGDLIFTIPHKKMKTMMAALRKNEHGFFSYKEHQVFMQTDFPLPDFYKGLFKDWGMDTE